MVNAISATVFKSSLSIEYEKLSSRMHFLGEGIQFHPLAIEEGTPPSELSENNEFQK